MARKSRPYDPHRIMFTYDVLPWLCYTITLGTGLFLVLS